jgi:hypothetical protein
MTCAYSYGLEEAASSDDTEPYSYMYLVPLQRTDIFASIQYKSIIFPMKGISEIKHALCFRNNAYIIL